MNDDTEPGDFSDFRRLIRAHLHYLFDDFAFEETVAMLVLPGMWVKLQNSTTRIMFQFEYGSGVWTTIGRLALIDGSLVAPDEYALDDLLALRAPNLHSQRAMHLFDRHEIEKFIQDAAFAYKVHAVDILRGDFAVFAELDRIQRERRRSWSQTE